MLFLIRHALTAVDESVPAEDWRLDPAGAAAVAELRGSYVWDSVSHWFVSTEPKAVATAAALTSRTPVAIAELREVQRPQSWDDEYDASVTRFFASPFEPARPGWETAAAALARFDDAMRGCAGAATDGDVAVVSHGLVISLWRAMLRGAPVDVAEWRAMRFPDCLALPTDALTAWLGGRDHSVELRRFKANEPDRRGPT